MQSDIFDYRNGKYQGCVNSLKQRNGLGIFIDDDLAFHVSHWAKNQLQGPTLLYLTHGKYIYGEWKLNQPHGLNIYRSGDTVLLSKFKQGVPTERCLLIFERYNFACVLTDEGGQWTVIQSGPVPNHKVLMKYIEEIGLPFPQHYFSLTKFACTFSNNGKIKIFPCKTNLCYFGMINGLGIVFNSNNGVVSVGHHQNEQLWEFGGRYSGMRKGQEGNFDTGEVVSYVGQRPTNKIHSIFQNMHKKSLNFCNEYFDPKIKVFKTIEDILQNKLSEIAQQGPKVKEFNYVNLNESLNYKEYDGEQSFKIYENREKIYSPPKKAVEKGHSNLQKSTSTYNQQNINSYKYSYPSTFNKSPAKQSKYRRKQLNENSTSQDKISTNYQKQQTSFVPKYRPQQQNDKSQKREEPKVSYEDRIAYRVMQKKKSDAIKPSFEPKQSQNQHVQSKQKFQELTFENITLPVSNQAYSKSNRRFVFPQNSEKRERSIYNKPNLRFEGLDEEKREHHQKETDNLKETSSFQRRELKNLANQYKEIKELEKPREVSLSPGSTLRKDSNIKRPTYEQIEQRRKRLLRDFKQLNVANQSPKKMSFKQESPVKHTQEFNPSSHSRQSSSGFIPLSISNRFNKKNLKTEENTAEQANKIQKNTHISSIMKEIPMKDTANSSQQTLLKSNKNYPPLQSKSLHLQSKDNHMQSKEVRNDKQNQAGVQAPRRNIQKTQTSLTPSKQKRTYQYMFD